MFLLVVAISIPALLVVHFVGQLRNTRRLVEDATRAATRIAAVLDVTPLPVRVLDADDEVLLMNAAAERWAACGLFETGERGSSTGDPETREIGRRVIAGEVFEGIEIALRKDRGEHRRVELWSAPISEHGQVAAAVSLAATSGSPGALAFPVRAG